MIHDTVILKSNLYVCAAFRRRARDCAFYYLPFYVVCCRCRRRPLLVFISIPFWYRIYEASPHDSPPLFFISVLYLFVYTSSRTYVCMYMWLYLSLPPNMLNLWYCYAFFSEMKHYNGDGNKNMMHGLKLNDVARNRKDYDWFFY